MSDIYDLGIEASENQSLANINEIKDQTQNSKKALDQPSRPASSSMSDQIIQIEEVANPRVNESNMDLTVVSESKEMHGSEELSLTGKISERIKSKNNISLERSFEESNCELIDLINKN